MHIYLIIIIFITSTGWVISDAHGCWPCSGRSHVVARLRKVLYTAEGERTKGKLGQRYRID